jgi:hypothetical protein
MMKKVLFMLALLCSVFAQVSAQEIILEEDTYVSYQDSLFILRTLEIANQGLEGVNDTVVRYIPPALDTAGLVNLIRTRALNSVNEKSARLARSFTFRTALGVSNSYDALLSDLGSDLNSFVVNSYANQLKGRYRVVTDTTNFLVDIIDHPVQSGLFRMVGTSGEGTWNILPRGAWFFQVNNFGGATQYLIWDRDNAERRIFRHPSWATPDAVSETNNIRFIKLD